MRVCRLIFCATMVLVWQSAQAATQVEVAPMVGPWVYSGVRCGKTLIGSTQADIFANARAEYGACGDAVIEQVGPWGTPEATTRGACGSTVRYPKSTYGVERSNARRLVVFYCNRFRDGYTLYRSRSVACPAGFRASGGKCLPFGLNPLKDRGPCDETRPAAGNPVTVSSGNNFLEVVDLETPEAVPGFARYYNSSARNVDVGIGRGWRHAYSFSLRMAEGTSIASIQLHRPQGQVYFFTRTASGEWASDSDVNLYVQESAAGFPLAADARFLVETRSGVHEYYAADGRILILRSAAGTPFRFDYAEDDNYETLDSVHGPHGHRLRFLRDGSFRISGIQTPRGEQILFEYADPAATITTLTGVAFASTPDAPLTEPTQADAIHYRYDASDLAGALTRVENAGGQLLAEWAYDAQGRAVMSRHGQDGTDETRFAYADGATTVTRLVAENTSTESTYRFTHLAGVPRLETLSGAGCADCGAPEAMGYDENGRLAFRDAGDGERTYFRHDHRGREVCRLEGIASGSPSQDAAQAGLRLTLQRFDPVSGALHARTTWVADMRAAASVSACPLEPDAAFTLVREEVFDYAEAKLIAYTEIDHTDPQRAQRTEQYAWASVTGENGLAWSRLSRIDGPRTDVEDVIKRHYFSADSADFPGMLAAIARTVDAPGQPAAELVTRFLSYDGNGRPTRIQHADGRETEMLWRADGRLAAITQNGLETRYRLDAQGRMREFLLRPSSVGPGQDGGGYAQVDVQIDTPTPIGLAFTRNGAGREIARRLFVERADGTRKFLRTEKIFWNLAGEPIRRELWSMKDGAEHELLRHQTLEYDAATGRVTERDATGVETHRWRDTEGRLLGFRDPRTPGLDAPGITWSLTRNGAGALTGIVLDDAGAQTALVTLKHDALARPVEALVANGALTQWMYNAFDEITAVQDPDQGMRYLQRDASGAIVGESGGEAYDDYTVQRDSLGRPLRVSFSDPSEDLVFHWDSYPGCDYGAGRLCAVEDALGRVAYRYDARGNRVEEHREIDGEMYLFKYAFDAFNRPLGVQGPHDLAQQTSRDPWGRPESVRVGPPARVVTSAATPDQVSDSKLEPQPETLLTRNYDAADRVIKTTFGTDLTEIYQVDALGRRLRTTFGNVLPERAADVFEVPLAPWTVGLLPVLAAIALRRRHRLLRVQKHSGVVMTCVGVTLLFASAPLFAEQAEWRRASNTAYDAGGRVLRTDTARFEYDARGRLETVETDGVLARYFYDANGNRGRVNDAAPDFAPYSNRLRATLQDTLEYDDAGRVVRWGTLEFAYNARGQLARVVRQGVTLVAYRYDWRGRRLFAQTSRGVEIRHYDDQNRLLAIAQDGRITTRWVWHAGVPVAQKGAAGAWLYLLTDDLGTVREGVDAEGVTRWRWPADGFGAQPAQTDPDGDGVATTVRLRFPGQLYEPESGLYYNMLRDYAPELGRYLTPDPLGLAGGLNPYLYAEADPLRRQDPLGLESFRCHAPLNPVHSALERGIGAKLRGLSLGPDLVVRHEYLCTVSELGTVRCGGQTPARGGNPIYAQGAPTKDSFVAEDCSTIRDDDPCFEACLHEQFDAPRPPYSLLNIRGENCQAWSTRLERECSRECGGTTQ